MSKQTFDRFSETDIKLQLLSGVRFDPSNPRPFVAALMENCPAAKRGSPKGQPKPRYGNKPREVALDILLDYGGFNEGFSRADLARLVLDKALDWEKTPCRSTIKTAVRWAETQLIIFQTASTDSIPEGN